VCQAGLRFADKGNQGLNRHGKGNRFIVAPINRIKKAHKVVSFGVTIIPPLAPG
jgi:hypothetical protein